MLMIFFRNCLRMVCLKNRLIIKPFVGVCFMENNSRDENIVDFVQKLKSRGISEKEYSKQISRFLEFKARERGIPINGCFELTPLCNLDCKMCYVHLDNCSFSASELLSANEWMSLIRQAYKAGMRSAMLTGGECLTYPAFDELYLVLHELGVSTDVLSNGVLIDNKWIDFFLKYRPQCIKISLYGSCDDVYEKVTGHRVFNKVYHNLLMIRDAGLPVFISITPSRYMQDDMKQLIETVESLNIRYEINARLFPARANTGRTVEDLSLDQYVELYRLRLKYHQQNPTPNDLSELPDVKREGVGKRGLRCGAGRSSFSIKYDGTMCTCIALDEFSVSAVELGFQGAWKQINEYAKTYPVSCECDGCAYLPVCLHCQAMHKNAPQSGHCDPRICERTVRLAQEGFFTYFGSAPSDSKGK